MQFGKSKAVVFSVASALSRLVSLLLVLCFAQAASAQTVFTYTNPTDGTINAATTCAAPLVRNFSVTDSFTISDVDLGHYATHTWRGDMRITLQHPDGTRVQLVDGDANSTSGDNLNVRLDDAAAQTVNTDSATAAHSTVAPAPFANTFSPNSPLAAFNGKPSNGTWRMEICDIYPDADNGIFRHAELYLTSTPPFADLSLTKTVSNTSPINGANVTYTLNVSNAAGSPQAANGVTVTDLLPAGVSFTSASGSGSYNSGTGVWTVGTLAPGSSATLTIQATVTATAGATINNTAEVTASSIFDLDSTPANAVASEDDYAAASFTVSGSRVAGVPPTLSCPGGSVLFDWDTKSWTAGSTNNTYALGALGNINFALSNDGAWLNSATFGGQAPILQSVMNGGLSPAQDALLGLVDLPNQSAVSTTTITLPMPMAGAQFTVFDVDYAAGQFADRVTITGQLEGVTVYPVLTNGISNYVIGNSAYGDAGSASGVANGNVEVTFSSPVDTIIVEYGSHALAPANPGQQGIAFHDITFCNLVTTLSVTKISSIISDPINGSTNPKAIPGAIVEYTFSVLNPNPVSVQSVVLTDEQPGDLSMCVASIGGGGPIAFTDGSPASGLTYNFTSLANGADSLEFSNDNGASWTYTPIADANGCDAAVTGFRMVPSGSLAPSRSFTAKARYILE